MPEVSADRMKKLEAFEKQQAAAKHKAERDEATRRIYIAKAKQAGITVSDKEVDEYIARKGKK